MPKIVLSYRRDDSQAATHYLFERLQRHFGQDAVFLDFDSIPYGVDFRDHITNVLHKCDVMLTMIGARWRTGSGGRNRLGEDNDWVRYEIEQALANKIWVVPVLLDGAPMPRANQLPESIRKLAYLNAVLVDTGKSFDTDTATLLTALESGFAVKVKAAVDVPNESARVIEAPLGEDGSAQARQPLQTSLASEAPARVPKSPALPVPRRAGLLGAGVIAAVAVLGMLVYWMGDKLATTAAGAGAVPIPAAPSSQFLTAQEADTVDRANKAAAFANSEALLADKAKDDASQIADRADAKARLGESLQYNLPWSSGDNTPTPVRYQGETVDVPPQGGGTATPLPSGLGKVTWDIIAHTCVAGADGGAPERSFTGQFATGHSAGLGVLRACTGQIIFGQMTDDLVIGYAVVMMADGSVFRGRHSGRGSVGIRDRKSGTSEGATRFAGSWNLSGAFAGYGIATCADGSQWKGEWADAALTWPGVGYDSHGALLARRDFNKGPSPLSDLCR
jgi:hypothetical protein